MAIDYFTKCVEAKPLTKITQEAGRDFVCKQIVYRFGIPHAVISDNGKQFDNEKIREFWEQFNIKCKFATPGHPQANGQVEVTNQTLLRNIKARLDETKGLWVNMLPTTLWAYHTTV